MRPSKMSRESYGARLTRSCSEVTPDLWLHALRLHVVHACCDPYLPVLFSTLLSDPFPAVVLVIMLMFNLSLNDFISAKTLIAWLYSAVINNKYYTLMLHGK